MRRTRNPVAAAALVLATVTAALLAGLANSSALAQTDDISRGNPDNHAIPVLKSAMPAVVNISTTRRVKLSPIPAPFLNEPFFQEFFGDEFRFPREQRENSLGSGVIVDPAGYIVTNEHVIAQADQIKVLLDGKREYVAKVIGADANTDIAVIKIEAKNLPVLRWGDSDKMEIGQGVFAIGNPFGLNQTVTSGIVSALGRANVGIAAYEDFIQTDAPINPGNSGGALINTEGELIGINTAIFSQSGGHMGIGFAVPSNMARPVMDSLIKIGRVPRGYLGVSIQEMTPDLAKQFGLSEANGAIVTDVVAGSPAAKAGIRVGDIIVGFNGKDIDSPGVLRNIVAQTAAGKEAEVRLIREKKPLTATVTIAEQPKELAQPGKRPEPRPEGKGTGLTGMEVRDLTPEIVRQLRLSPGTEGVVITVLDPNSDAALSGLRPGDVISEVNRIPIRNIGDYEKAVSKIDPKKSVLLLVARRGTKQFVIVER